MNRLGLALSGGGFRATLYHLGVIRCLRDNGVLPRVTHITTVSGGSIIGAHMALNWDRYCGSDEEFDKAAGEIIRFVRLDVRNRIVRRFPFGVIGNRCRALARQKPVRQWTRPGLLEKYYEQELFGDTPLSELPNHPRLHILSTNLSEGCLCSFNQNGLLMQRRVPGQSDRFERIHAGLATVPMAVAASSCFPGFFPPLELTGWDIGADVSEFTEQAFTDGGVYDNLGLRMFRYLEQSWVRHATPLRKEDFLSLDNTMTALRSADQLAPQTPLFRLRALVDKHVARSKDDQSNSFVDSMVKGLWDVIQSESLYSDPILSKCELEDASAQALLNFAKDTDRVLEVGDRLWLNRLIVESAIRLVIGEPSLRLSNRTFDGIIVSDAGGKFKVSPGAGGGLVSTALRSSDILMNRVWQLEQEAFSRTNGVVFIPISAVVDQAQLPGVLDPEVQRQASNIRTDLDFFTNLEISTLIQHGYGVAGQVCNQNAELFDSEVLSRRPWDPFSAEGRITHAGLNETSPRLEHKSPLQTARQLRKSSKRRIWSSLLHPKDWPSYVWLLLVILLVTSVTTFVLRRSARLHQQDTVLSAVAALNPDTKLIIDLLHADEGKEFKAMPFEEADLLDEPNPSGFDVVSESRIFDLRAWHDLNPNTQATSYARTRVRRLATTSDSSIVRLQRKLRSDTFQVQCEPKSLNPKLRRADLGEGLFLWELQFDLGHIPINSETELVIDSRVPKEIASVGADSGRFSFSVLTDTGLLQVWLLMPDNREYDAFEVSSYPINQPELAEVVVPAATVTVSSESVATFQLINPEPNRTYECRWNWE